MATFLANGAVVTVNAVDLSTYVSSVTIGQSFDTLEVTAMGDAGHKQIAGLENSTISIDFMADFATSKVNQTINGAVAGNGLVGSTTVVTVKPTAGTIGAANPLYTMTCLVTEWPQVYNVSELATISVTWPVNGSIVKTIA
jgi:hypothetical protein